MLLGRLDNGLGYYRFVYNGSAKAYVGVIAQEVRAVRPDAVAVGRDGYLRVSYERLGLPFRSYDDWAASGGWLPKVAGPPPRNKKRVHATKSVAGKRAREGLRAGWGSVRRLCPRGAELELQRRICGDRRLYLRSWRELAKTAHIRD